jgi:hypothetical protein
MLATESSIICISNIGELICVDKITGEIKLVMYNKNYKYFYEYPFYIEKKLYCFTLFDKIILINPKNGQIIKEHELKDKEKKSFSIIHEIFIDTKLNFYSYYSKSENMKREYNLVAYNLDNDALIIYEPLLELVKAIKIDSNSISLSIYFKNLVLDNSKQVYFEYNGWLYALEGE